MQNHSRSNLTISPSMKDFSTMSYGFKATQPITEMFSDDFRRVEDQTGRAKSITMIKYNDVK